MTLTATDVLARAFRQNWLNKISAVRCGGFSDLRDKDDSLTNLNWLPNMNLNKLTSQALPLSPIAEPSNEYNKNADLNQSLNQEGGTFNDIVCTWDQLDDSAKHFYKVHTSGKPPFSQLSLVCMAIQDIGQSRVTSTQICEWITANFPYYQLLEETWQHSVKNLLSISKCFQKVPRRKDEPEKGGLWRLGMDFEKYLNQSNSSTPNKSTNNTYSKLHTLTDSCKSSRHYPYAISKFNNNDSGHYSSVSSSSKKTSKYNKSDICSNYYTNQIKRYKPKSHGSHNQYGIQSSYSQFQHLHSPYFHEYAPQNKYCASKRYYMNPSAMSTPLASNHGTISNNFSQYPYMSLNGRSRNRSVINNESLYPSNRYNSSGRHLPYYSRSNDSNYESRSSSCNSAFSSFRNLVHKRSYQFSVRSPHNQELSQLSNTFSYIDHFNSNNSKNNSDFYPNFKYVDSSDISTSSDQFLINPELVKNEASFNNSPSLDSQLSVHFIKDESQLSSNNWWTESNFDSGSITTLQSCEKIEPTLSPHFLALEKDQQWVDEELNLEELDVILGLS